jgi:hypothetical protein
MPNQFHPVDKVAPFVLAACRVPRPTTVEALRAGGVTLPVPDRGQVPPRFRSTKEVQDSSNVLTTLAPPVEPITRLDALLWLYWTELNIGPFRSHRRRSPSPAKNRPPVGAAFVWRFIDNAGEEPLVGFTAYDRDDKPMMYYAIEPCPANDFEYLIRTDGTLNALAAL